MKKEFLGVFSLGVLVSIICLFLVGCGGSSSDSGGTAPGAVTVVDCATITPAATVTATGSSTFSPQNVPIAVNDVVRWISASTIAHTVTSGIVTSGTVTTATPDGKFDQPLLTIGSSVCLKFTVAGTYNYYCTYHYQMGMTGVVTVQ